MSEATELLEKMEHAGHGGGHGGGPGKLIGVTMALLGVMLAFCAAMVGSERTELIKTTVEQSNKWGVYQAEATKFRVMEADVAILHAVTPNKAELKKFDDALKELKGHSGKGDDEDTAEIKEAIHVSITELADVLTPDKEDEDKLLARARKYQHDMAEAKEDAEAFDGAIDAHHIASEWYERAQLCAEIGIVIASIALLLASRLVWLVSVVMGLSGAGVIGWTAMRTSGQLRDAEAKIEEAAKHTAEIEGVDAESEEPSAAAPVHAAPAASHGPQPAAARPAVSAPPTAPAPPKKSEHVDPY